MLRIVRLTQETSDTIRRNTMRHIVQDAVKLFDFARVVHNHSTQHELQATNIS